LPLAAGILRVRAAKRQAVAQSVVVAPADGNPGNDREDGWHSPMRLIAAGCDSESDEVRRPSAFSSGIPGVSNPHRPDQAARQAAEPEEVVGATKARNVRWLRIFVRR